MLFQGRHTFSLKNMIRNLFGKASSTPKQTPKEAIVKLRESLEMLDKREKFLLQKISAELVIAKENATKNKRGFFYWYLYFHNDVTVYSCIDGFKTKESVWRTNK